MFKYFELLETAVPLIKYYRWYKIQKHFQSNCIANLFFSLNFIKYKLAMYSSENKFRTDKNMEEYYDICSPSLKKCYNKPEWGSGKVIRKRFIYQVGSLTELISRVDQENGHVNNWTELNNPTGNTLVILVLPTKTTPIGKGHSKNTTFQAFMPLSGFTLPRVSVVFIIWNSEHLSP